LAFPCQPVFDFAGRGLRKMFDVFWENIDWKIKFNVENSTTNEQVLVD
jgi:hypothetical protein